MFDRLRRYAQRQRAQGSYNPDCDEHAQEAMTDANSSSIDALWICPRRDAICPHGTNCPFVVSRYDCKDDRQNATNRAVTDGDNAEEG